MIFIAFLAPLFAIISIIGALFSTLEGTAFEVALLELVVLGRIPATEAYIQYDLILSITIGVLWLFAAYKLAGMGYDKLREEPKPARAAASAPSAHMLHARYA